MKLKTIQFLLFLNLIFTFQILSGQEKQPEKLRTQLTPFLEKTYFNFNLGLIHYPYSDDNLNEGYSSTGTTPGRFSGRFLLGYKFKEDFAVQFGVMRPANWFQFHDIEYKDQRSSVWVNLWSLSFKKDFKLLKSTKAYLEFGFGNFARVGIKNGDKIIYDDAHYLSAVLGAGLQYNLSKKWDLLLNATYLPAYENHNQPFTFQTSLGATYHLQQVSKEKAIEYAKDERYYFPKGFFHLGYGSGEIGFFTNAFFSSSASIGSLENTGIPIFWHGDVLARTTLSLMYQHTVFRTQKYFSLDVGASMTYFNSYEGSDVIGLSVFPVLRFYLWRPKAFDFYTNYSVIGPAYVSKKNIDGILTGPRITYQDFMGIGLFFGAKRQYNADLKIMHFSNGNIFTNNDGVAIPLVFSFGFTL